MANKFSYVTLDHLHHWRRLLSLLCQNCRNLTYRHRFICSSNLTDADLDLQVFSIPTVIGFRPSQCKQMNKPSCSLTVTTVNSSVPYAKYIGC